MKSLLRAVAIVTLLSSIALQGRAQTSSAAIRGHVIDQTNGVVPNADVSLINEATNVTVATHTNTEGDFIFPNVQPGTFTVIVHGQGYKELRQVHLVLSASQSLSAGTLVLHVGEVTETVTVSAAITPMQTTSSERSGSIDTKQLENLLAIGRDAMALTRLMPGVVGGEGGSNLGTSGTPTVNGVNSEYNSATIDGVVGNTRGLSTLDTEVNLDAIQEITLMGSNYQAQYGKTAGGNFNFVTKSGTNQFHGALYYYFRNEDLNANSFFNKFNGKNVARAQYRFNTFGGTVGGPVYWPGHFNRNKDKLFFFVSIEKDPTTSPDGVKSYRIPTLAEIGGDFSQTYQQGQTTNKLINIKIPGQPGSACATTGTPGAGCFPGAKVPAPLINPQMQSMLQFIYDNTLGANPSWGVFNNPSLTSNNYNYQTNYSAKKPVNQEIFRMDYFPTEKLHMFFRGDLETVNSDGHASATNPVPWLMKVNYKTSNPNFVYNVIYTLTPTLVNEFNIGTSGWSETQLYDQADLAKVTLGANGFSLPSLYSGVNPLNLYPSTSFGVTNPANFTWDSRFPMADQVRSYSATDNVTKIWHNHTFKLGVDAQTDSYLQPNKNRVGTFNFGTSSNNINDSNFGYSNALMGNLNTYVQNSKLIDYKPRTNAFEWYEQDTWKVNNKLVLDLGIRNSWAMAQRLAAGNNFVPSLYIAGQAPVLYVPTNHPDPLNPKVFQAQDPTSGNYVNLSYAGLDVPNTGNLNNGILYVNTPGYPQGTTYGNGVLWAPRIGFAYSPTSKYVVRGGFSMNYNTRARSGQEGDLTNNAPTTGSATQYYTNVNSASSNYYASPGQNGLTGPFGIGHALPLHSPQLYTEETSLGIQHQLPAGIVLDVAYVGTFTKHASDYTALNSVPYGAEFLLSHQNPAGGTLNDNFFRPYPGFGSINMQYFNLTANYNSLQVKVTRRFHNGLEFGGAYTYSKTMDYTDTYNGTVASYQPLRAWNYGPASFDYRHNLVMNYLWSLPKASRIWSNFATRDVMDGWQISGIASYISGGSDTITTSNKLTSQNVTGGGDGSRAVLTCDPARHAPHVFYQWFNTACVENPVAGVIGTVAAPSGTQVSTGTGVWSPKINFFDPGYFNFDTALFKNWPIESKAVVQLRVETYNTFNHAEFNSIDTTAVYTNYTTQDPVGNARQASTFGQKNGTASPRNMQLALRITF